MLVYMADLNEPWVQCRLSRKIQGADSMVEPMRERQLADVVALG